MLALTLFPLADARACAGSTGSSGGRHLEEEINVSRKLGLTAASAVLALTLKYYAPSRLAAWVMLGRNQSCPLAQAVQSPEELKQQIAKKDEILAGCRLLETDPKGFKLAYVAALGGCNGCHAASDKPFLHVEIPDHQEVRMIDFRPQGR